MYCDQSTFMVVTTPLRSFSNLESTFPNFLPSTPLQKEPMHNVITKTNITTTLKAMSTFYIVGLLSHPHHIYRGGWPIFFLWE